MDALRKIALFLLPFLLFGAVTITLDQTTALYEGSRIPHVVSLVLFVGIGWWWTNKMQ